jgi:hypothetical protein
MLDDNILKKLRNRQANLLKTQTGSVSLSKVINDLLKTATK